MSVFAYCSFCGITHNDIKPSNILIKGGKPKVSDFGTSKQVSEVTNAMMNDNQLMTSNIRYMTPLYCSPNIFKKMPKINYYIEDVFSLGLTFLQMCCYLRSEELEALQLN